MHPVAAILSAPVPTSARQQVRYAVAAAISTSGCRVHCGHIVDAATSYPALADLKLTRRVVAAALANLAASGQVVRVAEREAADTLGRHWYLLPGLDERDYPEPEEGPRWLDLVRVAFGTAWGARREELHGIARRPCPVTTADVRGVLEQYIPRPRQLDDARYVGNALQQLASGQSPAIRKISRPGQGQVFWAPHDVPDASLAINHAYASDADRVAEAVRRAARWTGEAVSAAEVRAEIQRDPALALHGGSLVSQVLSDLARPLVSYGTGRRASRATRRVLRSCGYDGANRYSPAEGIGGTPGSLGADRDPSSNLSHR
jgi:hypothetical protein